MSRLRRNAALLALPFLVAAPEIARACSVCTAGRDDETRFAFIATTVFLSILPLTLIGGVAWWLRRAVRKADAAQRSASEAGLPPVPGHEAVRGHEAPGHGW